MNTTMSKEELIRQCRYYNGEKKNPYEANDPTSYKHWFWHMEYLYVLRGGTILKRDRDDYRLEGGKPYSGVPPHLLTAMYVSWGKYSYDRIRAIGDFYQIIDEYMSIPPHALLSAD